MARYPGHGTVNVAGRGHLQGRMHLTSPCPHQRLAPVPVMVTHPAQRAHVVHHAGRVGPLQRIAATAVRVDHRDVVHALIQVVQLEWKEGEISRLVHINNSASTSHHN